MERLVYEKTYSSNNEKIIKNWNDHNKSQQFSIKFDKKKKINHQKIKEMTIEIVQKKLDDSNDDDDIIINDNDHYVVPQKTQIREIKKKVIEQQFLEDVKEEKYSRNLIVKTKQIQKKHSIVEDSDPLKNLKHKKKNFDNLLDDPKDKFQKIKEIQEEHEGSKRNSTIFKSESISVKKSEQGKNKLVEPNLRKSEQNVFKKSEINIQGPQKNSQRSQENFYQRNE